MPLPKFGSNQLLPEGIHLAGEGEVRERCVNEFPTSRRRPLIFQGLRAYQGELLKFGLNVTQWIDGSFVDQTRVDPDDVDIANFCDPKNFQDAAGRSAENLGLLLGGGESTKKQFMAHTFLIQVFPPEEGANHLAYLAVRSYWQKQWSRVRDYSKGKQETFDRGRKGFIEMTVGKPENCPRVSP